MDCFSLNGKKILVTGASSGIGRATAILCAQMGAQVILLGRKLTGLNETLEMMPDGEHRVIQFDLLQFNEVANLIHGIVNDIGLLDGLAHCAGMHVPKPLRMITAEHIDEIVRVNVSTGVILAKHFRSKHVSVRPSSIVFLSSIMATVGQPAIALYALSKGALVAATKSLAAELALENIRVNVVLPGVVRTPMSEDFFEKMGEEKAEEFRKAHLLGIGEAQDVASSIVFLLSPAAKWITGSSLIVDGGYTAV